MLTEELTAAELLFRRNGETLDEDPDAREENDAQLALRNGREDNSQTPVKVLPRMVSIISHKKALVQELRRVFTQLAAARPAQRTALASEAALLVQKLANMRGKLKVALAASAASNPSSPAPRHPSHTPHLRVQGDEEG